MAEENRENVSFELFNYFVQEQISALVNSVSESDLAEIIGLDRGKSSKVHSYYVERLTLDLKKQWENILTNRNLKEKYEELQNCIEKYKNSPESKWRPPIGDPGNQFKDLYFQAMEVKKNLLESQLEKVKIEAEEAKKCLQMEGEKFNHDIQVKLHNILDKCNSKLVQIQNLDEEFKIFNV